MTQHKSAPTRDQFARDERLSESAPVDMSDVVDLTPLLAAEFDPSRDRGERTKTAGTQTSRTRSTGTQTARTRSAGTQTARTRSERTRSEQAVFSSMENTDVLPRTPQHRRQPTSAAKGRVLIAAMAAGAAAAAAYTVVNPREQVDTRTVLASSKTPLDTAVATESRGVQLISVKPAARAAVHAEELANGVAYAAERAEREARLQRPLFVMPTKGIFTSGFGYRWGALHAGIDLAAPIGTPIYAASDGVVVDAGPTAGYGAWVKIRHADGTVTLYGHVNTWDVQIGQRVFAGDQIATVGNRGNSTGPHCHFEVLLGGTNRTDPVPWLAARGISVGPYSG